ncbi:hypothetical protein IP91_00884 [Pseudoduganella lurida]|uniref:Uncharacterized protein n=1 Tax=Pseudoduganella lurida TaxID=1036180 RepID=A0A562RLA9_9BURK|nr:hypothetical protein [Pseudoduganella lurida]TWI69811.1 hypothetical protein IP91_00884 [Pseudoduganella lurida]
MRMEEPLFVALAGLAQELGVHAYVLSIDAAARTARLVWRSRPGAAPAAQVAAMGQALLSTRGDGCVDFVPASRLPGKRLRVMFSESAV